MSHTILFLASLATYLVILGFTIADSDCKKDENPSNSKCHGCPPMLNGSYCASTTHYNYRTPNSCGCNETFAPNYAAAVNAKMLNPSNPKGIASGWEAPNCGLCFKLCPTGGCTTSNCKAPTNTACINIMVKDCCDCGLRFGRNNWCNQTMSPWQCKENPTECKNVRNTNRFGYPAHFDLLNDVGQIVAPPPFGLGYENIEVTFKEIDCPSSFQVLWGDNCHEYKKKKETWSEEYLRKNKGKPDF